MNITSYTYSTCYFVQFLDNMKTKLLTMAILLFIIVTAHLSLCHLSFPPSLSLSLLTSKQVACSQLAVAMVKHHSSSLLPKKKEEGKKAAKERKSVE